MVEVLICALAVLLCFIMGTALGARFAKGHIMEESLKGKLRIIQDEDGESFIFLEFSSRKDKSDIEAMDEGELVTFYVSHK